MNNLIFICGDSGSGKTKLAHFLNEKINNSIVLECDRYHKWQRGDYHWKYFTHLNPGSNELKLMQNDILELQKNIEIYQKDYDHKTGLFTQFQKIKPNKNIIVVGLHVLFFNFEKSIKIYLDTDDYLKITWKISRDVTQRGYCVSEVLKKIEERKNDFKNHIEPQIKNSDLIIKKTIDTNEKIYYFIFSNKNNEKQLIYEGNQGEEEILKIIKNKFY